MGVGGWGLIPQRTSRVRCWRGFLPDFVAVPRGRELVQLGLDARHESEMERAQIQLVVNGEDAGVFHVVKLAVELAHREFP